MKRLYKLIFGTVLALNLNNNSVAIQFENLNFDMFGFMNDMATASVNNKDYTQSKVNCVLSAYSILCVHNIADSLYGNNNYYLSRLETRRNLVTEINTFIGVLKNNNINIRDQSSLLNIYDELCNVHLKEALKKMILTQQTKF